MDGIASGFELILSDAMGETILRREGALQHCEFLHKLERRIDILLKALCLCECYRHAIEDDFVLEIQPSIDTVAETITCDARRQEEEGIDLAACSRDYLRQVVNKRLLDGGTHHRLFSLKRNLGRGDFDALADLPGH